MGLGPPPFFLQAPTLTPYILKFTSVFHWGIAANTGREGSVRLARGVKRKSLVTFGVLRPLLASFAEGVQGASAGQGGRRAGPA